MFTKIRTALAALIAPELTATLEAHRELIDELRDEFEAVVAHAKDLETEVENMESGIDQYTLDNAIEEIGNQVDRLEEGLCDLEEESVERDDDLHDRVKAVEQFIKSHRFFIENAHRDTIEAELDSCVVF